MKLAELGAFTLGWDALQFHQYQVSGGYRFSRASPFLTAGYTLRRFRPVLDAAFDLDLHRQAGELHAGFEFRATRHANWLDWGLAAERDSAITAHADLDWTFSDALQYRFCVAPVQGRVLALHTDARSRTLLSDKDIVRVLGYWTQYIGNPPSTWSLRTRFAAGTSLGANAAESWQVGAEPGILGVRGYRNVSEAGRSIATAGLQFRAPLWWVERGIGTGPLFLQNINAAAFADAGLVSLWPEPADSASLARVGVGAELRADLIVSHLLPVSVYVGCGFGLNPLWSQRLYFGLSSTMLEDILSRPAADRLSFRHLPEIH